MVANGLYFLKKALKNKVMQNGVWMYILQFFNTVVPLLTLPYITRILGTHEYGTVSIAINILGYYQVIVEYGFGMSATRKVALNEADLDINRLFTSVISCRAILLGLCFLCTGVLFLLSPQNSSQYRCLLVLLIGLCGSCIQLNWLFQGFQQMKYISLISIISRTVSVVLIFIFVKSSDNLLLYCFLYSASPALNGLLGLIIARHKYRLNLVRICFADILSEMKSGWYVFTTQLSSKVFGSIGVTFLGIFSTASEVGIYSAIQKIPMLLLLAWSPIGQVIYPVSSRKMNESFQTGKAFVMKLQKRILPIFGIAALIVAIFSRSLVTMLFGTEYAECFFWTIPLLIWLLLSINNNFLGIQILLCSGHDKEYSKCFQLGVICTVIVNLAMILLFKGTGASVAPALSEAFLTLLLYREIRAAEKKLQ